MAVPKTRGGGTNRLYCEWTRPMMLRVASVCALALAGCDSMADGSYLGDPISQLQGVVMSDLQQPPPKLSAAIVWIPTNGVWVDGVQASLVEIEDAAFPSRFTIP